MVPMAAMEQLIEFKFCCRYLSRTMQNMNLGLTDFGEMMVEPPRQGAKLVRVGGFGSHMNREITSYVNNGSVWMKPGRQELWTDPEHGISYILTGTSFKLYIIYLLQH